MRILLTAGDVKKAENYLKYLKGLGAEIDVITPTEKKNIFPKEYDLLVLSGGKDVNPKRYNEEIKYESVEVDDERDELEFGLIEEFLRSGKPIFGICRGFQVLTVFFGGSLYQDLEMEGFKAIHKGENGEDNKHEVVFSGVFKEVFGSEGFVNSNHHQGLKGFPEKLRDGEILAVSEDHLVEAFISKKYKVLAVQWHPERHESEISQKLLEIVNEVFGK